MSVGSLLAVFAHPDDESFGVGGTLAKYAAAGVPISLLTVTRGERSTLGSSARYSTRELAALREAELRCAAGTLRLKTVRILGYPDGGLPGLPAGRLIAEVGAMIAEVRPSVVLTFDAGGVTGHPDHIAVAEATRAAFAAASTGNGPLAPPWRARLYYWALPSSLAQAIGSASGTRWVSTPDDAVGVAVDTSAFLATQQAAIACHRSQSSPPPLPLLARLAAQRGREYFTLAASTVPGDAAAGGDLFSSLALTVRAETYRSNDNVELEGALPEARFLQQVPRAVNGKKWRKPAQERKEQR